MGKSIGLSLFLAFTITTLSFSQAKITGKVTHQSTGKPVEGANIFIVNFSKGAVTDEQGGI